MPDVVFMLLGDLASETWYKATAKCQQDNGCIRIPATAGAFASPEPRPDVAFVGDSPTMVTE